MTAGPDWATELPPELWHAVAFAPDTPLDHRDVAALRATCRTLRKHFPATGHDLALWQALAGPDYCRRRSALPGLWHCFARFGHSVAVHGHDAAFTACAVGDLRLLRYLRDAGVAIDDPAHWRGRLTVACSEGRLEVLKELVEVVGLPPAGEDPAAGLMCSMACDGPIANSPPPHNNEGVLRYLLSSDALQVPAGVVQSIILSFTLPSMAHDRSRAISRVDCTEILLEHGPVAYTKETDWIHLSAANAPEVYELVAADPRLCATCNSPGPCPRHPRE